MCCFGHFCSVSDEGGGGGGGCRTKESVGILRDKIPSHYSFRDLCHQGGNYWITDLCKLDPAPQLCKNNEIPIYYSF